MFGIFHSPKLLIDTAEKVAIERELLNLGEFFGWDKWNDQSLLRPEELAKDYQFDHESLKVIHESLVELLELDAGRIRLIFSQGEVDSVSGMELIHSHDQSLNEDGVLVEGFQSDIRVGTNLLLDSLLAELLRMLVAEKLILSGYVDASDEQLPLRAEIATVFFGFGLFTVNKTVSCNQSTETGYHYFSMVKLGALNSFGTGYLLALVLWHRNQSDWSMGKYLRPDAESSYQKTLAYLEKTNDTLLADPNLARLDATTSISTLETQLKSCTATGIVWILEGIQFRTELERDVLLIKSTLFQLLRHRDIHVGKLSLHLISFVREMDSVEIRELQKLARGRNVWMASVAANILSTHLPFEKCEHEFARVLDEFEYEGAANAAQMASRFGTAASKYSRSVCHWIHASLNKCNYGIGLWYMLVLLHIHECPLEYVQEFFSDDEDLLRGALELFEEANNLVHVDYGREEQKPEEIKDIFAVPAWVSI